MTKEEIITCISELVNQERELGDKKHFKITHSDHESYAVILEEYEEVKEELQDFTDFMADFWKNVRNDDKEPEKLWALKHMSKTCYNLIYEAIQLAGVVEKAADSICERGVE